MNRLRPPAQQFVGRARELDELGALLDEAATGRGCLALVTGEPGIGKTKLIQELGRIASERGCRVLAGRYWEEGGAPAHWPGSRSSGLPRQLRQAGANQGDL